MERITAGDDVASLEITWFNNPYATQKLQLGQEYYFQGIVTGGMLRRQMVNPQVRTAEQIQAAPFEAVYPQTRGTVQQRHLPLHPAAFAPRRSCCPIRCPRRSLQNTVCSPRPRRTRHPLPCHRGAGCSGAAAAHLRGIAGAAIGHRADAQPGRSRHRGTHAPRRSIPFLAESALCPHRAQRRAVEEILNDMAGDTA